VEKERKVISTLNDKRRQGMGMPTESARLQNLGAVRREITTSTSSDPPRRVKKKGLQKNQVKHSDRGKEKNDIPK